MFNLLHMDLYRMKRSRSMYVCLGLLLLASMSVFVFNWLLSTPQGQVTAIRITMFTAEESQDFLGMLGETDTLEMFRQIGLDGGFYSTVFGIGIVLFVCMDYQSGFMKNIMALNQNRWAYVGSKMLAAGILNILYLVLNYMFVLLLNGLLGNMLPWAGLGDVLFYMAWAWLVTTAFAGLLLLVCVLARSVAAGVLAAVLLGSGMVVTLLQYILSMFHVGGWLKYSIYMTLSMGPTRYMSPQDLKAFAVGAGFLVLYPLLAGSVLKKQDI